MSDVSNSKSLKEELFTKKKNACLILSDDELKKADDFCEGYKRFLDSAKTEREAVSEAVKLAKENGFAEFDFSKELKPGDKVYTVNRGKAVILAVIGTEDINNGVKISAAHIDSPRVDLKQNPIYEDGELALFKTHYYGGIKKYQWTTIPLSLHGVVFLSDGKKVEINIGENEDDPIFCITDLLPHLAQDQMKRPSSELVKGEELNILIGSRSFKDDNESQLVKLNILKILNEKYGICEDDFVSAELEAVPAFKAKDLGFRRPL